MFTLLLTLALASEPTEPPPADVPAESAPEDAGPMTDEAFAALVASLVATHGIDDVTVAAPGFDASDRVRAALAAASLSGVGVSRVSELVEPAQVAQRLVKRSACVLYVDRAAGRLEVTRFGACADGAGASPAAPPSLADREAKGAADRPQRPPSSDGASAPPSIARREGSSDVDVRLLIRSDWDLALARVRAPDPVAATVMSGFVGFGSGHFYARSPGSGAAHLLVQLAGTVVLTAGGIMSQSFDQATVDRGVGLVAFGTGVVSISRLIETVTVPRKASRAAARELEEARRQGGY